MSNTQRDILSRGTYIIHTHDIIQINCKLNNWSCFYQNFVPSTFFSQITRWHIVLNQQYGTGTKLKTSNPHIKIEKKKIQLTKTTNDKRIPEEISFWIEIVSTLSNQRFLFTTRSEEEKQPFSLLSLSAPLKIKETTQFIPLMQALPMPISFNQLNFLEIIR